MTVRDYSGTLTLTPKMLGDELTALKPAVTTRSAVEAFSGVRITATPSGTTLTTTDMELTIIRRLPHAVADEFDILVSHAELAKVAKLAAKRERVDITVQDDRLVATAGARSITLRALRIADLPALTHIPGAEDTILTVAADELAPVIERAVRFASKDETRPVLTGVALDRTGDAPRLQSTDSYRLCDLACPWFSHHVKVDRDHGGIVNIPARVMGVAAKEMRKAGRGMASIAFLDHRVRITVGTTDYITRRIDGQYPHFRQLIPDTAELELTAPVAELIGGVEVAKALLTGNTPLRLRVNGAIAIDGEVPDGPTFREVIESASYRCLPSGWPEGEEWLSGFNPDFLLDILKAHVGETVTVRLLAPKRPALFVEGDDRYLLMPIRLNI